MTASVQPPAFGPHPMSASEQVALHGRYRPGDAAYIEGDAIRTWGEVNAGADAIARALIAAGVAPGDRIALLFGCETDAFEIMIGVSRARAVAAPLSPMLTPDITAKLVADCGAKILFHSDRFTGLVSEIAKQENVRTIAGGPALDAFRAGADPAIAITHPQPDDLANIIYSSGTTGAPKGIAHTHAARWGSLGPIASAMKISPSSRAYLAIPPHSNGAGIVWGPAAYVGATTILHPGFDIDRMFDIVEKYRPTHAFLVPVICQAILAHPRAKEVDFTCFDCAVVAGAPTPEAVKKGMIELTGEGFAELWGLTEGPFTFNPPDEIAGDLESVGRPAVGCDLKIVDDNGEDVTGRGVGEVVARGVAMMQGYWNRPDADEEATWVSSAGEVFFRTGDMGELDEKGRLHLRGRAKDMLISGGLNVFPGDIEAELDRHEDVRHAAVIGAPHPKWGETPVAFIVFEPGATTSPDALKDWVNARLAKHQRVSDVVTQTGDFPRNVLGKVLKKDLAASYNPPWEAS